MFIPAPRYVPDSKCRARNAPARVAVPLLASSVAACQSTPPKRPSLALRQAQILRSIGFSQADGEWLPSLPEPISFEFDQAKLKPEMQHEVDHIAGDLLRVETGKLRVEGHSDTTGPRTGNILLAQRRAEAVARKFTAQGFASDNVQRAGFGPDYPAAANDTRSGRARNRRVEVIMPADALASIR